VRKGDVIPQIIAVIKDWENLIILK
jgi:hypothetical protein